MTVEANSFKKDLSNHYGIKRDNPLINGLLIAGLWVVLSSIVIWSVVVIGEYQRVSWSQAVTVAITMGGAVIAYRQWISARQEISIDKYYDRLDSSNQKLALLGVPPRELHVYAELDKLEYVTVKYKLGYLPPELALRAFQNFEGHCRAEDFRQYLREKLPPAAYLDETRRLAGIICSDAIRSVSKE